MAENNDNIIRSPMELNGLSKYFSLIRHRVVEYAIWTFCELGIADLMNNHKMPITALELSQLHDNNWNAEYLYRLLRVIADSGIITQTNTDEKHLSQPEQTIRFEL
ncbi:unnamed protein product [Adineta ricciae]|uniref:O-methyltransferase dimerisation domain-containing protein n=1 Tax=Adineta ricciae TaxID=249248 RepID=A0A815G0W1_ADIRI|nr:unnamed protein product [Adineta ricciae]